jgi:transposase
MQSITFVGGDVSKATIHFAVYGDEQPVQVVANQKRPLMTYLKQLPPQTWLAVEATNTYHRLVVDLAYQAHRRVFVLNPKDVSHYRQGVGYRAKTDRVDAQLIARYLAKEQAELKPWQPPTPTQEALETLITRRVTVTQAQQALRQSLRGVDTLRAAAQALDRQFVATVKTIDQQVTALIQQEPQLLQSVKHLHTVPGFGPLIAAALATVLQRIPFAKADAAVAFSGLDPRPRDSGQCRGQRKLSKRGPAELRRLLYIAAMTAARHPLIKAFYERQRAKRLSAIAAYNVLARKLLRTAWSIVRYNRPFDLQRFVGALT